MKKAILIPTMVLFVTFVSAQDRIKEAGLSFYDLDGFGLNYKVGTKERLWRLNSIYGSASKYHETNASMQTDRHAFGISFRAGREFRKKLAEDFDFRYGFDVSFGFERSKNEFLDVVNDARISTEKRNQYTPGVNAVIGVNYLIKGKIVIGGEVLPGLSYSTGKTKNQYTNGDVTEIENSGFNFGISSSSVLFVVAYRF